MQNVSVIDVTVACCMVLLSCIIVGCDVLCHVRRPMLLCAYANTWLGGGVGRSPSPHIYPKLLGVSDLVVHQANHEVDELLAKTHASIAGRRNGS